MSSSILKVLENIISQTKFSCLLFLIISFLLRFLSFHFSVIDHDESTYLIIANELNNGQQLYTDVIDTKPAGIFLIFAFIQLVFGKSIIAVRLFSALVLGVSGFLLSRISLQLKLNKWISFFNGIVFIVSFSAYRMGLSINTELYFTFFVVGGFYLLQQAFARQKLSYWFLGGLSIGFAFIIKYVVLAGFGAFSLYFLYISYHHKKITSTFFSILVSSIGLVLPFLILHLYFLSINRFDDFYYSTYEVVSRYSSTLTPANSFSFFIKFHLNFFPFLFAFCWALFSKKIDGTIKLLVISWYTLAWIVVLLPGKEFKHYYLQLLPPISLLTPLGISLIIKKFQLQRHTLKIIYSLIIIVVLSAIINQSYFLQQKDIPRLIAQDIRNEVANDDIIWVDKKYHITYYLLNLKPPSEFVHPTLMFNHTKAFQIETNIEANRILNQKPAFIIHKSDNLYFINNKRIQDNYSFYKTYGKVTLLKRKVSFESS